MTTLFSVKMMIIAMDSTPLPAPMYMHKSLGQLPGPVPPAPELPCFHIELPTPQFLGMGMLLFGHVSLPTISHMGMQIVGASHDIGPLLVAPHVPVPMPAVNILVMVTNMLGSRQPQWASSTVKMSTNARPKDDWNIAGGFPMPQKVCMEPISLPTAFCLLSMTSTSSVGISLSDFIFGFVDILAAFLFEKLVGKLLDGIKWAFKALAGPISRVLGFKGSLIFAVFACKFEQVGEKIFTNRIRAFAPEVAEKELKEIGEKTFEKTSEKVEEYALGKTIDEAGGGAGDKKEEYLLEGVVKGATGEKEEDEQFQSDFKRRTGENAFERDKGNEDSLIGGSRADHEKWEADKAKYEQEHGKGSATTPDRQGDFPEQHPAANTFNYGSSLGNWGASIG